MRPRRRWVVSIVDAALSRVDEKVLPRLSRGLGRLRDRTERARLRPGNVAAVIALVAAVALAAVTLLRPDPGRDPGSSPAWVGVHEGDSIPDYLQGSHSRLAALAAQEPTRVVYALVSFGDYLHPAEVAAVLAAVPAGSGDAVGGPGGAVGGVHGYARVPLTGRQTERVTLTAIRLPEDLVTAMSGVADRKELDASRYATLAQEQPEGTLRQIYASNAEVSQAEARAYRDSCACVFALVVRASARALVTLAGQAPVRAVDPAPELSDPAGAVFAPPLPEQTDRATPPADEVLPSATATA